MYESFFKLREKPFSLLPDPGFIYLSPKHQEALTILEYGLLNQAGFIVLTGEIGVGKTTLMRCLLDRLDESFTIGLISHTHQSLGNLMEWVCSCFDLKADRAQRVDPHQLFVDFVIDQYAKGKRTLLIVDEAQNLGSENLEHLRLLSNINSDKNLVLQLMLLGQPQLRDLLRQPELEQFVQRVAASYHLGQLGEAETARYIRHRMAVAGGDEGIFTREACEAVFGYSKGVPRLINLICDTALVYAYAAESHAVTVEIVDEFVEAQGAHLLIPLQRPTEPRRSHSHAVPAENDDEAAEEQVPASPNRRARSNSVHSTTRSPTAGTNEGLNSLPASAPDASAPGDDGSAGPAVTPGSLPQARVESQNRISDEVLPWISARPKEQIPVGLRTTTETSQAVSTAGHEGPSDHIVGGRVNPPAAIAEYLVDKERGRANSGSPPPAPADGFGQTPADTSVRSDTRAQSPSALRWWELAAIGALLALLAAGFVMHRGPESWASLGRFVDRAIEPDQGLPAQDKVQTEQEVHISQSQNGASKPVPPPSDATGRPEAAGAAIDASALIHSREEQQPVASVSAEAADGIGVKPENTVSENDPDVALSAPQRNHPQSSAVALTDEPPSAESAAEDPSASAPVVPTQAQEDRDEPPVGDEASPAVVTESGAEQATSDASMATGRPEPVPAEEAEGAVDEPESPAEDAPPHEPTLSAAQRQAPPDVLMSRLEAELRELAISVERTDPNRLTADLGDSVQFAEGSVFLGSGARAFLKTLAEDLKKALPLQIRVIGHTDHRGGADVNARLSEQRAENVAQCLAANGIADEYLSYEGKGEAEPKIGLTDEWKVGPSVNRRIEIELTRASANGEALR